MRQSRFRLIAKIYFSYLPITKEERDMSDNSYNDPESVVKEYFNNLSPLLNKSLHR